MVVKKYKDMLEAKSVIREMSAQAAARGKEIGYDNVFDYSWAIRQYRCRRNLTR